MDQNQTTKAAYSIVVFAPEAHQGSASEAMRVARAIAALGYSVTIEPMKKCPRDDGTPGRLSDTVKLGSGTYATGRAG
jgi:hypothetical protein